MNLALPPEIQKLIKERVQSGKYCSSEDVVTAAITNLGPQEHMRDFSAAEVATLFPAIKKKLAEGLSAAKAGRLSDGEAFFDELEREDRPPVRHRRKTA